jgi:hypothetical protein
MVRLTDQINLSYIQRFSDNWREFFGFSTPTGGNLFASVKLMKKYYIYLHP